MEILNLNEVIMSHKDHPSYSKDWNERAFLGLKLWKKVKKVLQENDVELPKTTRRPDVRLVLKNNTDQTIYFLNPGEHSITNQDEVDIAHMEKIEPGEAAMAMLKGDTLEEQMANAQALVEKFDLLNNGLSEDLIANLSDGSVSSHLKEMYGPSDYDQQANDIVDLNWEHNDGSFSEITKVGSDLCTYGARSQRQSTVMRTTVRFSMQCEGKTPEAFDCEGMCVEISEDYKTKKESSRPQAPTAAREIYGKHYDTIPVVQLSPEGLVESIDLKDGSPIIRRTSNVARIIESLRTGRLNSGMARVSATSRLN